MFVPGWSAKWWEQSCALPREGMVRLECEPSHWEARCWETAEGERSVGGKRSQGTVLIVRGTDPPNPLRCVGFVPGWSAKWREQSRALPREGMVRLVCKPSR